MGKLILKIGLSVALSMILFTGLSLDILDANTVQKLQTSNTSNFETVVNCRFGQCKAIAKSTGNRCKHCVSNSGDSYCYQH